MGKFGLGGGAGVGQGGHLVIVVVGAVIEFAEVFVDSCVAFVEVVLI